MVRIEEPLGGGPVHRPVTVDSEAPGCGAGAGQPQGREDVEIGVEGDKGLEVGRRTESASAPVPGYQGHVPQAQDAFGTSHWRGVPPNAERAQSARWMSKDARAYEA